MFPFEKGKHPPSIVEETTPSPSKSFSTDDLSCMSIFSFSEGKKPPSNVQERRRYSQVLRPQKSFRKSQISMGRKFWEHSKKILRKFWGNSDFERSFPHHSLEEGKHPNIPTTQGRRGYSLLSPLALKNIFRKSQNPMGVTDLYGCCILPISRCYEVRKI